MKRIYVGTCGFSKSRKLLFKNLDVVEIQQTFYDPPESSILQKIRSEAPEGFVITMKAWMLITHKYNKKLWKRIKRPIYGNLQNYGEFQDTDEVWWAWKETLRAAKDLDAKIIVLQTPASFRPTSSNVSRLKRFLKKADRDNRLLAWEPRGEWWSRTDLLESISREYSVIIAGDYLRGRVGPCTLGIGYARLHGLGGKEVNYKYKYTDKDLIKLKSVIFKLNCNEIYVLFNNIYSYYDALRFKRLLSQVV